MPSNIEMKIKLPEGLTAVRKIAVQMSCSPPKILNQVDTYFGSTKCRLKLREEDGQSSLIAYERPDETGPKQSDYIKTVVEEPGIMVEVLKMSLGILGKVTKHREVYFLKWQGLVSRVHLDVVEGVGEFMEFEVIIEDGSQAKLGEEMAHYLSTMFDIDTDNLLEGSYIDMILRDAPLHTRA